MMKRKTERHNDDADRVVKDIRRQTCKRPFIINDI